MDREIIKLAGNSSLPLESMGFSEVLQEFRGEVDNSCLPPVILITGALGSGKTTLVKGLLAQGGSVDPGNIEVLVADAGTQSFDSVELQGVTPGVIIQPFDPACFCCDEYPQLSQRLHELGDVASRELGRIVNTVIIEPSGVANVRAIFDIVKSNNLDCKVVAVIDCEHFMQNLRFSKIPEQIAFANSIVLTRWEKADDVSLPDIIKYVRSINPEAGLYLSFSPDIRTSQYQRSILPEVLTHTFEVIDPNFEPDTVLSNPNVYSLQGVREFTSRTDVLTVFAPLLGEILRAKGIVTIDSEAYEMQIVSSELILKPTGLAASDQNNSLLIVTTPKIEILDIQGIALTIQQINHTLTTPLTSSAYSFTSPSLSAAVLSSFRDPARARQYTESELLAYLIERYPEQPDPKSGRFRSDCESDSVITLMSDSKSDEVRKAAVRQYCEWRLDSYDKICALEIDGHQNNISYVLFRFASALYWVKSDYGPKLVSDPDMKLIDELPDIKPRIENMRPERIMEEAVSTMIDNGVIFQYVPLNAQEDWDWIYMIAPGIREKLMLQSALE
jgi:G3E family GTPase